MVNYLKVVRLVLTEKPEKSKDVPVSFRPLCIVNTMSKLLETFISMRLNKEIEMTGTLAHKVWFSKRVLNSWDYES